MDDIPPRPSQPDLPNYVVDPLENQDPDRLEVVATYAKELAAFKRAMEQHEFEQRRAEDAVDDEEVDELAERDDVDLEAPNGGAYVTIKTTKETSETSYQYYYWQWRDGDSWKNEYIAPVNPKE